MKKLFSIFFGPNKGGLSFSVFLIFSHLLNEAGDFRYKLCVRFDPECDGVRPSGFSLRFSEALLVYRAKNCYKSGIISKRVGDDRRIQGAEGSRFQGKIIKRLKAIGCVTHRE